MIQNHQEMENTQGRIAYFQCIVDQLRVATRPDEFPLVASGYQAEIEKMRAEALEYLMRCG